MTPDQFKAWRKHLNLSQPAAANVLGISPASVYNYEKGERSEDGRPVVIPKTVELACAAVALGIMYYQGPQP